MERKQKQEKLAAANRCILTFGDCFEVLKRFGFRRKMYYLCNRKMEEALCMGASSTFFEKSGRKMKISWCEKEFKWNQHFFFLSRLEIFLVRLKIFRASLVDFRERIIKKVVKVFGMKKVGI